MRQLARVGSLLRRAMSVRLPSGGRAWRHLGGVSALAILSSESGAQAIGKNIELVGTVSALFGAVRLSSELGVRTKEYGGIRLDGGLQFAKTSVGLGGRLWFGSGGQDFNADGADGFVAVSRRINGGVRTAVRATAGFTAEEVQKASDLQGISTTTGAFIWSAGIEHEFTVRAWLLVVSVDLVMPPSFEIYGRKRPVLEFGLGSRRRFFQPIRPL